MLNRTWERHGLIIGLVGLCLLKLWVIHTEETYGSSTQLDALWYVESARHWYWWRSYSWTAFVRPCAYPLFIALVHSCGIPLRIAIELAQMGGYGVLICAFRKAGLPRSLCLTTFALAIFHPATLLFNNHSMSDSFYAAILPLALGGSLLTLLTRQLAHAVWTGAAFAVLWNTREESFLIPPVLVLLFLLALAAMPHGFKRVAGTTFWMKRIGALGATMLLLVAGIYTANYRVFHSFSKSDLSSPAFENVFKALLRIKPTQSFRYISVTREALRIAYEVSPTFARLQPEFDGTTGQIWSHPVYLKFGTHEFGPWFQWALRYATANSGLYKDPVTTNQFFENAAREINQACDEGRIPSRVVLASFLDPGAVARIRYLPRSIARIAALFLFRHHKVMARADTDMEPWMSELYAEMVFRRPQPKIDESNAVVVPDTISAKAAVAAQNLIGSSYVYLFVALAWAALAGFGCLLWFVRRWTFADPLVITLVFLGTTIAARVVFFSFLDATWWMSGSERYLFPVMPLTSCFFGLLIYKAVQLCRNGGAL